MDTDRFYDSLPREQTLLKTRPWYVLAGLLLLISILTRQPVVFFATGFALILGLLPELWYHFALRSLVVSHHLSQSRAHFGERLTLTMVVENQKWLPLPWLEIEEELPAEVTFLTGHVSPTYKPNRNTLINACSLWAFQRVTRRYHLYSLQRGKLTFGPTALRTTDPFGWLPHEQRQDTQQTLIVTPLLAPLPSFGLPAHYPFGAQTTRHRLLEDPLRMAGVRAYQWGDDPRRINWKATARVGSLQSNIYEPGDQRRILLLLDSRTFLEAWLGVDPEIQELTICVAASLANIWLDEGYPVGLATNGTLPPLAPPSAKYTYTAPPHIRVPMARGERQQTAILTALGQLMTFFSIPMQPVIHEERRMLPYGTTVVLVSSSAILQSETVEELLDLRRHGMGVHLALTGNETDGTPVDTADLPIHWLGGREVWHELFQNASRAEAGPSTANVQLG